MQKPSFNGPARVRRPLETMACGGGRWGLLEQVGGEQSRHDDGNSDGVSASSSI